MLSPCISLAAWHNCFVYRKPITKAVKSSTGSGGNCIDVGIILRHPVGGLYFQYNLRASSVLCDSSIKLVVILWFRPICWRDGYKCLWFVPFPHTIWTIPLYSVNVRSISSLNCFVIIILRHTIVPDGVTIATPVFSLPGSTAKMYVVSVI